MPNKGEKDNSTSVKNVPSARMSIFLSFDLDYADKDYEPLPAIFEAIGDTPATFFLVGNRHPAEPVKFPKTCQIGNHSFMHEPDWYEVPLGERVADLERNHNWIQETYGVDCKVYRSPHLRNFEDTADEMEKKGYKREMACAECSVCQPMQHAHLKQYFSSFHHFRSSCNLSFLDNFEEICKRKIDFTFVLDPLDFTPERIKYLKEMIIIGKKYGIWEKL